jgi:uncharacterized protein YbjQ (UPF0145 family)
VLATDLLYLQNEAKQAGANAVTDIVGNYNNTEYRDSQNFEHAEELARPHDGGASDLA